MNDKIIPVEEHPWPAFVPDGARVLMLGTFPPKPERWSMDFFFPNPINDMWRIMGLVFYNDKNRFWIEKEKRFNLPMLKDFLTHKFLEIVETINLEKILEENPTIEAVVTAGEKATGVIAEKAGVVVPKTGTEVSCTVGSHRFVLYRMPSSSRAYPLPLLKKAEAYRDMFLRLGYEV